MAKRAGSILALVKCSNLCKLAIIKVAAILIVATFIVCCPIKAYADIAIKNLPSWQAVPAQQSLAAVQKEITSVRDIDYQAEIIKTVAQKIFTGYNIETSIADSSKKNIDIIFTPEITSTDWDVAVNVPNLHGVPLDWFNNDIKELRNDILGLLNNVPIDSLAWSDEALAKAVKEITGTVVPGWNPSLIINIKDDVCLLNISFTPEMPLVLAIHPTFVSNSLPTLLHGELRDEVLVHLSQFIGSPVVWIAKHKVEMNRWAENIINAAKLARQLESEAAVNMQPSQVSQLNARVESKHYTIGAWATVYAGTSEKSAEVTLHLGRKIEFFRNFAMELYTEGIIGLQEWNVNGRFGLRWRTIKDFWMGGEWDTEDDKWWGKLSMDPQLHKIYAWLRIREDGKFNGAIGWRATENVSFEIEYDDRYDDRLALKLLGNL